MEATATAFFLKFIFDIMQLINIKPVIYMELETAQEGGQCPHGYPLHISTECPDCQPEKEELAADMNEDIIKEESRQESGQRITGAEKELESPERPSAKVARELKARETLKSPEGIVEGIDMRLIKIEKAILTNEEKEKQVEQVKEQLREIMAEIHELYNQADPAAEENKTIYNELIAKMKAVLTLKSRADEITSRAFSEIFYEFSDFIDNAFVLKYIQAAEEQRKKGQGKATSFEHATQEIYGRTVEEVEEIKNKNRAEIAKKIKELAQKPYLELGDIEELHVINNHSIVPASISKMRRNPGENVAFGTRVGLLPEDVPIEMQSVIDRANELFDKRALGMSKARYEAVAAKLHNEMLDIHPFLDRNGSTALLFLEAIMAREDYDPPAKRDKDYYRKLRKVVNNNPVAISAVAYEQYSIKYRPGYFASERIIADKDKKAFYDRVTGLIKDAKNKEIETRK